MDLIFKQLGDLVLDSVPTMILFIILVLAYNFVVRRPLSSILAERRARTSGAIEQARAAMAAAEAETAVYEDKLRSAKAELFHAREQRLKQWANQREHSLQEVRRTAGDRVKAARADIEASAVEARGQIESVSSELSARVLAAVLPAGVSAAEHTQ